jgi:RNA polymerase sigma-70 factor, ECF subfamily
MLAEARMRELYDLHAGPLYRYLMSLTFGQRQAAEDLVQETLLRAWRNLDSLNADIKTLRPWLFTVARRIAIDASRARRRAPHIATTRRSTIFRPQKTVLNGYSRPRRYVACCRS